MHPIPRSSRRFVAPLVVGLLLCLAWSHFHVHTGIHGRLTAASHHRLPPLGPGASLAVLFGLGAAAAAAARAGLSGTIRLVPNSAIPWGGGRPITREDLLAGAAFGAYGANRTAAVHQTVHQTRIAYRRAGPLVVVLGGPSGDPEQAHAAQAAFRRWAGRRPIVWYGAGSPAGHGFHLGQEAIVNLQRHELGTARSANLRHSVSRARRAGVEVVTAAWSELPEAVRAQLRELEWAHRRRRPLQFRLTLSTLKDAMDGRAWTLALGPSGRIEAAATWLDSSDRRGVVLDLMRRRDDAVPGAMELLIHSGLERARESGRLWASLGIVSGRAPDGLRRFKAKFRPEWHDRYIAAPGIPLVLAAAAAAWAHIAPWRAA